MKQKLKLVGALFEFCEEMANALLFQIANAFLFLSYISINLLYLRIVLLLASVSFIVWAVVDLGVSIDTIVWNSIFFVLNLAQVTFTC